MNKIEFLAASLPHELKVKIEEYDVVSQLYGIDNSDAVVKNRIRFKLNSIKPIVRPFDLTKEIEHEGKKFVPIVELAKMAWINEPVDFHVQNLKNNTVFIAFANKKNVFGYDYNSMSFFGALRGVPCSVVHQLQLFQQLIKWHFWPNMPEGEEVVYVSENFNPYK